MGVTISIADYDPRWPQLYVREAHAIAAALGPHALLIEHAGSTSVPGLPAKPVIDIVLAVADSADEESYALPLASAGYELRIREPEWHQHRLFKRDHPPVNLHVFSSGCPEIARMLRFRDWLRTNPADRDLYAAAKRTLSGKEWESVDAYAQAKTTIVEEIISRATRNVSPGPVV